jgi:hypothetical protein
MLRISWGSAPSACLGEGTLVCLRYADMVEPVERHGVLSGGIQEESVGGSVCGCGCACGFWSLFVGSAGGAFPGRSTGDRGGQDQEPGLNGVKRGRCGPLVLLGGAPQMRLFTT